ncbi:hypothetical protein TUM4637_41390 [Shewanella hafniensis]|nr:hypothetical protein TUM4637_41390 [Shewanella hafniensis]
MQYLLALAHKLWSENFALFVKNRGVEDILIACVDGLEGLPDAI